MSSCAESYKLVAGSVSPLQAEVWKRRLNVAAVASGKEYLKGGILMAVVKMPQESQIGITVANGVSSTGANLFKTLRFSNVKPAAPDQDVYDVGASLAGLQANSLVEIVRTDEANLTAE